MNHVKYANKVIYGQYGKLSMKLSRNRVKLVLMTKIWFIQIKVTLLDFQESKMPNHTTSQQISCCVNYLATKDASYFMF